MTRTVTLVRHHVTDQVLHSDIDANDVDVSHTFDSADAAHTFIAKTEVREALKQAGVATDSLTTMYYDEVETEDIG